MSLDTLPSEILEIIFKNVEKRADSFSLWLTNRKIRNILKKHIINLDKYYLVCKAIKKENFLVLSLSSDIIYRYDVEELLYYSAKTGNMDLVRLMIKHGARDWGRGLLGAAKRNQIEIVMMMLNNGILSNELHSQDWYEAAFQACRGGYPNLAFRLIIQECKCWAETIKNICREGHYGTLLMLFGGRQRDWLMKADFSYKRGFHQRAFDIVNRALNEWIKSLIDVTKDGHLDIILLLINKYRNTNCNKYINIEICLEGACRTGKFELAKFFIERGATNIESAFYFSCYYNHQKIARYVFDLYEEFLLGTDLSLEISYASKHGWTEFAKIMMEKSSYSKENFIISCAHNNTQLVDYMIDKGIELSEDDLNKALSLVVDNNNFDLMKKLIKLSSNKLSKVLQNICFRKRLDMLNLLIDKVDNFNEGLYGACRGGHLNLIEKMIEYGADDWNYGFSGACKGNQIEAAKMMIKYGADNLILGFSSACDNVKENIEIIYFLIENGYNYWNDGLIISISRGHINIALLMIKYGDEVDDFYFKEYHLNAAFLGACQSGEPYLVKLMIEKGATNLEDGLLISGQPNQDIIHQYIHEVLDSN